MNCITCEDFKNTISTAFPVSCNALSWIKVSLDDILIYKYYNVSNDLAIVNLGGANYLCPNFDGLPSSSVMQKTLSNYRELCDLGLGDYTIVDNGDTFYLSDTGLVTVEPGGVILPEFYVSGSASPRQLINELPFAISYKLLPIIPEVNDGYFNLSNVGIPSTNVYTTACGDSAQSALDLAESNYASLEQQYASYAGIKNSYMGKYISIFNNTKLDSSTTNTGSIYVEGVYSSTQTGFVNKSNFVHYGGESCFAILQIPDSIPSLTKSITGPSYTGFSDCRYQASISGGYQMPTVSCATYKLAIKRACT